MCGYAGYTYISDYQITNRINNVMKVQSVA